MRKKAPNKFIKRIKSHLSSEEKTKGRIGKEKVNLSVPRLDFGGIQCREESSISMNQTVCSTICTTFTRKKEISSRRAHGSRYVTIWSAISCKGEVNIVVIDGEMDSQYCAEVPRESLVQVADGLLGEDWWFQHDNAAMNSSILTEFMYLQTKAMFYTGRPNPPMLLFLRTYGGIQCGVPIKMDDSLSLHRIFTMLWWSHGSFLHIRSLYQYILTRFVQIVEKKVKLIYY